MYHLSCCLWRMSAPLYTPLCLQGHLNPLADVLRLITLCPFRLDRASRPPLRLLACDRPCRGFPLGVAPHLVVPQSRDSHGSVLRGQLACTMCCQLINTRGRYPLSFVRDAVRRSYAARHLPTATLNVTGVRRPLRQPPRRAAPMRCYCRTFCAGAPIIQPVAGHATRVV